LKSQLSGISEQFNNRGLLGSSNGKNQIKAVVNNFNLFCIFIAPDENNSPSIVYSDGVVS